MYKPKKYIAFMVILVFLFSQSFFYMAYMNIAQADSDIFSYELFRDDFEDGNADGWSVVQGGPELWSVFEDVNTGNYSYNCTIMSGETRSIAGDSSWDNYSLEAGMKVSTATNTWLALFFRYKDNANHYFAQIDSQRLHLYKRVAGTAVKLSDVTLSSIIGSKNAANGVVLKIEALNDSIKIYLDGQLAVDCTDNALQSGKIGIRAGGAAATFSFDNFTVLGESPKVTPVEPPPTPTEDTLFLEDFENGQETNWTIVDSRYDNFNIVNDNGSKRYEFYPASGGRVQNVTVAGEAVWSDYRVSADFKSNVIGDDAYQSLIFRYSDPSNYYMMSLLYPLDKVALYKNVDNRLVKLSENNCTLEPNTLVKIKVEAVGNEILVYVDGVLEIYVQDDTFNSGKVGLRGLSGTGASMLFDNIHVEELAALALPIPPVDPMEAPAAVPEGTVFYRDDFENSNDSGHWIFKSNWSVGEEGGSKWLKTSSYLNYTTGFLALRDAEFWADYTYTVDVRNSHDDGYPMILFRAKDTANYYMLQLRYLQNQLRLMKFVNSVYVNITPDADVVECNLEANETYRIKIETVGSTIRCYVNGQLLIEACDASYRSGTVGLIARSESEQGVQYFDNITVTGAAIPGVPAPVPETPPSLKPYTAPMDQIGGPADFYVAVDGSDDWDGSLENPFGTLQKAVYAVRQAKAQEPYRDYKVYVRGGTYRLEEPIRLNDSDGADDNYRITYAVYPGEEAVISGGQILQNHWSNESGNLWSMDVPDGLNFRQLFTESERMVRSREPDAGAYFTVDSVRTSDYRQVTLKEDIPDAWSQLNGVEVNSKAWWHYNRQKLDAIDGAGNKLNTASYIGTEGSSFKVQGGSRIFLENALVFVDQPGEWFLDAETNKLYYMSEEGADPNAMEFTVPVLETLLEVRGSSTQAVNNVNFYGLSFKHTEWIMPAEERKAYQAGHWGTKRGEASYSPSAAVIFEYVEGSRIQNCAFSQLGEGGIALERGSHSNLIGGNRLTDVGSNGVQIARIPEFIGLEHPLVQDYEVESDSPESNTVVDNTFINMGTTDYSSVVIWIGYAHNTWVHRNHISGAPYTGISLGWIWTNKQTNSHHNLIEYNLIHDVSNKIPDGGAIYSVGPQAGSRIVHNLIYDSGLEEGEEQEGLSGIYAHGIYVDEMTSFIEVAENYVYDINGSYVNFNRINLYTNEIHNNYTGTAPDNPGIYGPIDVNPPEPAPDDDAAEIPSSPGSGAGIEPISDDSGIEVLINGERKILGMSGVLSVSTGDSDAIVEIGGQSLEIMQGNQVVLEVKSGKASYLLPVNQIKLDKDIEIKDIKIQIQIQVSEASEDIARLLESSAKSGNYSVLSPVVNFTVKYIHQNKETELSRFDSYAERTIKIDDGISLSGTLTGVAVEEDGTVRHIPTRVVNINDEYHARISSIFNGNFTVIEYSPEFKDVGGHWAMKAIDDMGARRILAGTGNNMFKPDGNITGAEFITLIVKALGLKSETSAKPGEWYDKFVETAAEFGIISNSRNMAFDPVAKISREQAMIMIAKAAEITGLKTQPDLGDAEKILRTFKDSEQASEQARASIAACVGAEIVSGRTGDILAPKDRMTRAEAVVVLRKLLQKSELIF